MPVKIKTGGDTQEAHGVERDRAFCFVLNNN